MKLTNDEIIHKAEAEFDLKIQHFQTRVGQRDFITVFDMTNDKFLQSAKFTAKDADNKDDEIKEKENNGHNDPEELEAPNEHLTFHFREQRWGKITVDVFAVSFKESDDTYRETIKCEDWNSAFKAVCEYHN